MEYHRTAHFLLCYVEHNKKNWQMIDAINGAKTSTIIYSVVEIAKANNLKSFDYVQHFLEEIPQHMDNRDYFFLEEFLSWAETLPVEIRKVKCWWL